MARKEADHRLQLLRARYAGSLAAKRDALVGAWQAFLTASADVASRRELAVQIHRLCGSAAAYGYVDLGAWACAADRLLASPAPIAPDVLSAAVHALIDALERAVVSAQSMPMRLEAGSLRVVLVENDPVRARLMARQLGARGCEARESGSDELWQTLVLWPCHAVVLGDRLHGEIAAEMIMLLRREPAFARIALLCCSAEHAAQVPRSTIQAGCDAVVARDDGIDRLFEAICACVAQENRSASTFPLRT
jgi:CheY-like chemotaxis protein